MESMRSRALGHTPIIDGERPVPAGQISTTDELAPLLTLREVALLLRLSEKTARRMVARGRIPCVRFGRAIRFVPGDVLAWLSARREG